MLSVVVALISGLLGLFAGTYLGFYLRFKETKIKYLQGCYIHLNKLFLSIYKDDCHDMACKFQEYLIENRLYIPRGIWEDMWDFKNQAPLVKELQPNDREAVAKKVFRDFNLLVAQLSREAEVSMASILYDLKSFFTLTLNSILKRVEKTSAQRL